MKCVLAKRRSLPLRISFYLFCLCGAAAITIGYGWIDLGLPYLIGAAVGTVLFLIAFLRRVFIPVVRIEYDSDKLYVNKPFKKEHVIPFKNLKDAKAVGFGMLNLNMVRGTYVVTQVGKTKEVASELMTIIETYRKTQAKLKEKEKQARSGETRQTEETKAGWGGMDGRHGIK